MEIKEKLDYCLNCKTKPCQKGCPLGNDIPNIIALLKEDKTEEAYRVLTKTTVLPNVCSRICPHSKQCQGKCTRGIKGEPVEIGNIEKYLSDFAIKNNYKIEKLEDDEIVKPIEALDEKGIDEDKNEIIEKLREKTVAVVGGGPAGLTCAAFLARAGVKVTIYEKHSQLGGILSHGIPEFRLERKVLENNLKKLLDIGNIDYKLNCKLGQNINISELREKYDAIFLAVGANKSSRMNIEGENLEGVYGANEVLEYKKDIDIINKRVAIIGGGNVAMDMARTAKRNGADEVLVIYRRAEEQMPAEEKEIQEAKAEGIQFLFQTNLVKIIGEDRVKEIECVKTELVSRDGESRLYPVNIAGSNFRQEIDIVLMAVGSKIDENILDTLNLDLDEHNKIKIDEKSKSSCEKVLAGGDFVGAKGTVAWAARSGRDAAYHIMKYLCEL